MEVERRKPERWRGVEGGGSGWKRGREVELVARVQSVFSVSPASLCSTSTTASSQLVTLYFHIFRSSVLLYPKPSVCPPRLHFGRFAVLHMSSLAQLVNSHSASQPNCKASIFHCMA